MGKSPNRLSCLRALGDRVILHVCQNFFLRRASAIPAFFMNTLRSPSLTRTCSAVCCFFLLFSRWVDAREFIVDSSFPGSGKGTAEEPYVRIGDALRLGGAIPGDVITIRKGVYRETIVIPKKEAFRSPNPSARQAGPKLILQPAPGAAVIVKGSDLVPAGGGSWVEATPAELMGLAQAAGTPKLYRYTGKLPVNPQQVFVHPRGVNPNDATYAHSNVGISLTKLGYPTAYMTRWRGNAAQQLPTIFYPVEGPLEETAPDSGFDNGNKSLRYMLGAGGRVATGTFYVKESGRALPQEGARSRLAIAVDSRALFIRLGSLENPNDLNIEISIRPQLLKMQDDSFEGRDCGNLHVKNLQFMHSSTTIHTGNVTSAIESGHSSIFEGCQIEWMDAIGICGWDFSVITGCTLNNNGNCGYSNGGACLGLVVSGCKILTNTYRPFYLGHHAGGLKVHPNLDHHDRMEILVENCEVVGNNGAGLWIDHASELRETKPYQKILRNNFVHDNTLHGIWCEKSQNALIYGNVVDQNVRYGIFIDGCRDFWIFNNTVLRTRPVEDPRKAERDDESAGISIYGLRRTTQYEKDHGLKNKQYWPSERNRVLNNIITLNHTQMQLRMFYNDADFGTSDNLSDYNCLWKGEDAAWKGPFPRTLVGLTFMHRGKQGQDLGGPIFFFEDPKGPGVSISPHELCPMGVECPPKWGNGVVRFDQHSVVGDPGFIAARGSVSNYHLITSSPAIDRGAAVFQQLGIEMTDLYGVRRPQHGLLDIGAVEAVVSR